jgi:hypothetical protein
MTPPLQPTLRVTFANADREPQMIGDNLQVDSFDVEPAFKRRALVLSRLSVGDRHDFVWARLSRPVQAGPHRSLKTTIDLEVVALGPRHVGATWDAGPWPLHVYVCRPIDPTRTLAEALLASELEIEYWATVEQHRHVTFSDTD